MENVTFFYDHFDDDTIPEELRRSLSVRVISSVFTLLVGVVSIVGNSAVVFVSYADETLHSQTSNFFIVYMSMADAIAGFFAIIPSGISVAADSWPFGNFLCKFHNGVAYTCCFASVSIIALISFDRAVAVLSPLKYHNLMNASRVYSLCGFVSVLSVFSFILAFSLNWTHYSYEEAQCAFDWRIYEVRFFSVPSIVVGFYIPGLFMIICNALVISTALKWERKKVFVMRMNESSENNENMKKTIITTLVLVITYYVCVSPYVVSKNVYILTGLNIPPLWNIFCTVLFYMSSAVNPFIYAILRKDYTAAFKTIPRMLSQRFF